MHGMVWACLDNTYIYRIDDDDGDDVVSYMDTHPYVHKTIVSNRYQGGPGVSFVSGAWASPQTFVTASTSGGLATWDRRGAPKPQATSPVNWGPAGSAGVDTGALVC